MRWSIWTFLLFYKSRTGATNVCCRSGLGSKDESGQRLLIEGRSRVLVVGGVDR